MFSAGWFLFAIGGGFFQAKENQIYVLHSSENLELPVPNKQLDTTKWRDWQHSKVLVDVLCESFPIGGCNSLYQMTWCHQIPNREYLSENNCGVREKWVRCEEGSKVWITRIVISPTKRCVKQSSIRGTNCILGGTREEYVFIIKPKIWWQWPPRLCLFSYMMSWFYSQISEGSNVPVISSLGGEPLFRLN